MRSQEPGVEENPGKRVRFADAIGERVRPREGADNPNQEEMNEAKRIRVDDPDELMSFRSLQGGAVVERFTKLKPWKGINPGYVTDFYVNEFDSSNRVKEEYVQDLVRQDPLLFVAVMTGEETSENYVAIEESARFAVRCCWEQMARGRKFVIELPWGAPFWENPMVKEIADEEEVYVIVSGPTDETEDVGWITNCADTAQKLHESGFEEDIGEIILNGVEADVVESGEKCDISELPVADDKVVFYKTKKDGAYWDDVRGGWLPKDLVEAARGE